jgi:hypothetical protein
MTTVPLPTSPGTPPPTSGGVSRATIILAVIAGALLLAVVAIVFLLIGRGSAEPGAGVSPTPTPTTSDSASPTPTESDDPETQAPVDNSTRFLNFDADLTVECDPTGQEDKPEITFSWTAANAVEAWYTPSDDDAKNDDYMRFPNANSGSNNDLTDEHLFPCNHDQYLDVTITLVGPGGEHVSKHVVYEDVNWGSGGDDGDD